MANVYPNLVDWANTVDPDNSIAQIAWLLAQANEMVTDMISLPGNEATGHQVSVNVGLPQGTWRSNNQGVSSSKASYAKYRFGIGELVSYSMVDKSLASLGGNVKAFRWNEDQAHIEGMTQQIASALIYSNEATSPAQFTGFAPYYNTISTASAETAENVIDGGGTGSNNASLWLNGWGSNTNFTIFPPGSQAGLLFEDKGDTTPLYDSNGNRYEGFTSYFCWKIGLAIKNWEYNVRIANLDTTTAGLAGVSPPDLFVLMSQAVTKLPTLTRRASGITQVDAPADPAPGIRPAFYCNRTVRTYMDIQAIRDKNVLISMNDYAGQPVMQFREIPIRIVDALTNSEAALT